MNATEEHFDDAHIHTHRDGRHYRHGDGVEVDGNGNPLAYTDWTICYGFLDGDLGDFAEHADLFAEAVREALEAAYPGALVETPFQANTSGSTPYEIRPAAYDPVGNRVDEEFARIDRIAGVVFQAGTWIPDVQQ